MKKIGYFVSNLNAGGLETYLLRFLRFNNGVTENIVFCKQGHTGVLEEEFIKINVKIECLKVGYCDIISWFKLYQKVKKYELNTICDFTGNFAGIVLIISFLSGIKKRIVFYRGSTDHFEKNIFRSIYNKLMNLIVRLLATKILSNSKAAIEYFFPNRNNNNEKYEVIYNGINYKEFSKNNKNMKNSLGIPENSFVIGNIGRYDKAKNHKTIINVAIDLCQKYSDIYFILCGNGIVDNLENIIINAGLENRIKLLNYTNEIIEVYNTIDLFYFPSLTEGQPNALIEAMVLGIPIVSSNISTIKDSVPNFLHHQLIEPNDVKGAIKKILNIKMDIKLNDIINCKEWALKKYSADLQFTKFIKQL